MERCRKRLVEESTCSICLEYFTDPVTLECGHNFCRSCITNWDGSVCPQCRELVRAKRLKPNKQLANMVEITKEMSFQRPLVVTVEESVQECKDHIKGALEILRKESENILEYKAKNEKESQDLLKEMQAKREETRAVFRQHHHFLDNQENLLLAQMDEVEMEIVRRRDEHQASLSGKFSSLDNVIQELEKMQQQSGKRFLQNAKNVLERCPKIPSENPVEYLVELKWRLHDFSDISFFLEVIMKKFQESLISGLPLHKANVTLDPDTAHPQLVLSEDRKGLRFGNIQQPLPDNPERYDVFPYVLGKEGFTTGRHFWEVTVGHDDADLAVGVARKSVRRKGWCECCLGKGVWKIVKSFGSIFIPDSQDHTPLRLKQEPKRIRVTLDCGGGRVAFFDADTMEQLYVFSVDSFCGETLLPFFYLSEKAQLRLSS